MRQPLASVVNLGCRVNRVESDRIVRELAEAGLALVDEDEADVVVINTCAVTGEAEAKTRKAVRHALSLPREPLVVATGCAVNLHADELEQLSGRVICEPSKIDVAARIVREIGYTPQPAAHGSEQAVPDLVGRHRIGVKVQDGCDNRCSYCIVWKARGASRSVPVEQVVGQVRELADAGVPEVVLTGVNLGCYDGVGETDSHVELDELLTEILARTDVRHLRLSSIEPQDVNERLLEVVRRSEGRIAPFFHMPLQSGCTETLVRMRRAYTADRYAEIVGSIRETLPSSSVSCDVIVGFPGETDREFEHSYDFCERMGFSRMHVFRYSRRPGTPAAEAPDQVPPEVMAERAARLRNLGARLAREDRAHRVGTIEPAVIEGAGHGTLASFHRVAIGGGARPGDLVHVRITGIDETGDLLGEAVEGGGAA